MANRTELAPRVRGVTLNVRTVPGALYFLTRSGFRYLVTGLPVDGKLRDNASWLHDATVDYRGGPVPKYSRARWRRVARRNALVGVPGALATAQVPATLGGTLGLDAWWVDVPWWDLTQGYACTVAGGALIFGASRVRRYAALYQPYREYIGPATRVACQIVGVPHRKREALHMLDLPPGWGQGDETEDPDQLMPRLYLPAVPLDAGVKKRIVANVGARLGIPHPEGEWSEVGGRAHVTFKALALPAKSLPDSIVRPALESSEVTRPVLGFSQGNRPVTADYDEESPHVLVSGPSGTGKSVLTKGLHAQRMRHGNGLIVLDFKRMSHSWAHDMPRDRALYFYKVSEIHEALCAIEAELTARIHGPADRLGTYRPVDILVEELNSLSAMLRAYWQEERARIKRDNRAALKNDPSADVTEPPMASPALRALALVVQLGRQVSMHLTVVGQRVSAQSLGPNGGDVRENFATRMIARWTRKTWAMLSDAPYVACPSGPRGLWAVVQGESVSIVRVPMLSDEDARTLALSGPCPSGPILSATSGHGQIPGQSTDTIDGHAVQVDRLDSVRGQLVSLSESADTIGLTLTALQVASKRAEGFPGPREVGGPGKPNRYDLAELIQWRERRDGVRLEVGPGAL